MDKIKILAAVLALAGCMENGMGMEENEISGHNVIIRSLENDKLEKIIEESNSYDISSVTFDGIDFFEDYDEKLLNNFLEEKDHIIFLQCKHFPRDMYGIEHVNSVEFDNCDISLYHSSEFVKYNCTLGYLKNFTYTHNTNVSMSSQKFQEMVDYFSLSAVVNGNVL